MQIRKAFLERARSSTVERPPCTREAPGSNPGESISGEASYTVTAVYQTEPEDGAHALPADTAGADH